jgi:peptide/nickel transport system permease protein
MSATTELALEPAAVPAQPAAPSSRRRRTLRPGVALAVLFLAFLVLAAVVPGLLATHGPLDGTGIDLPFLGALSPGHPLGTDDVGRDTYSRLVYGARPSLLMGLGATAIGVAGGTLLGLVAGLGNRWVETVVMRLVDILLAIPDLLLALVVIALLGAGSVDALIAVGVAAVPNYARIVRAQTRVVRRSPYVEAASTLGLGRLTVIRRHVLPNAIRPLLVLATLGVGSAIGVGASLSFLGLGAKPPAAEWGSMLSTGIQYLSSAPGQVVFPALTVTATVLAITVAGRALKRRSEGRAA